ncbi:MAG: DUF3172 domain-containing protein [Aphanocapsa sp. GSE-SYN-MK-11-07L]|jgi:hypothetical protein|nr:DUF3172 domain-containing protein [Aphanocapsa sp. GSE-SYN-MK-11-07L]
MPPRRSSNPRNQQAAKGETRSPGPKPPAVNSTTLAIVGAVFVLGIGIGVAFSKTTTLSPENVASTEFIDKSAPNPEFCIQYGASAISFDTRVFVTFNPFNVFVSQSTMQPGCVMRINNIAILEQRKLVTSEQMRDCRQRMNTFGYTGNLDGSPQISCLYQSNVDKNKFLNQPGVGAPPPETTNF